MGSTNKQPPTTSEVLAERCDKSNEDEVKCDATEKIEALCAVKVFDCKNFKCLSSVEEISYYSGGCGNINYSSGHLLINSPVINKDLHFMLSELMRIAIYAENSNLLDKKKEKILKQLACNSLEFNSWKTHFYINLINLGAVLEPHCPSKDLLEIRELLPTQDHIKNDTLSDISYENWLQKLNNFLSVFAKLIKISKFQSDDLYNLFVLVLWIGLDQKNGHHYTHKTEDILIGCIFNIVEKFPLDVPFILVLSSNISKLGYINSDRLQYCKICSKILSMLPASTTLLQEIKQVYSYKALCLILGIKDTCKNGVSLPDMVYMRKAMKYILQYKMSLLGQRGKTTAETIVSLINSITLYFDLSAGHEKWISEKQNDLPVPQLSSKDGVSCDKTCSAVVADKITPGLFDPEMTISCNRIKVGSFDCRSQGVFSPIFTVNSSSISFDVCKETDVSSKITITLQEKDISQLYSSFCHTYFIIILLVKIPSAKTIAKQLAVVGGKRLYYDPQSKDEVKKRIILIVNPNGQENSIKNIEHSFLYNFPGENIWSTMYPNVANQVLLKTGFDVRDPNRVIPQETPKQYIIKVEAEEEETITKHCGSVPEALEDVTPPKQRNGNNHISEVTNVSINHGVKSQHLQSKKRKEKVEGTPLPVKKYKKKKRKSEDGTAAEGGVNDRNSQY